MNLAVSPVLFFDPQQKAKRAPRSLRRADDALARERRLFCFRCGHRITDQDWRIAINGAHAHTFTNPHGLTFHIGCFRDAPGCAETGTATTEFTWFPGYAWCIADCAHCGVHLGWQFTSSQDRFYGLIHDRLSAGGHT